LMKTTLFSKILGVGLAIGLVFALGAAVIPAGEAQADEMEWGQVTTPSWDDFVIAPETDIYDYAVGGDDGSIVFAIGRTYDFGYEATAWMSDDGGVTWTDITDTVNDAIDDTASPMNYFADFQYGGVAMAPDNEDWVAIAGLDNTGDSVVVASEDGGDNFSLTGDLLTAATVAIYDIAVSPEVDGVYNIAVAGTAGTDGVLERMEAGTWLGGSWADATDSTDYPGWFASEKVVAVAFSPNFDMDDSIVCMTSDTSGPPLPYLQEGLWESGGSWNDEAGFPDAVQITNDGNELWTDPDLRALGFALPDDFDGTDPSANNIYLYVDAYDSVTGLVGGYVMIFEDGTLTARCGPSGDPLLASIDVHGDHDTAKAMIGTYVGWDQDADEPIDAGPCEGVTVYHTVELDDCCPEWESACKDPSGPYMAMVAYAPDGDKAFATTTGHTPWISEGNTWDESAFSVSLDDGVSFNQIGLIDTDIDRLSDLAVCPDCETAYLATINTNGEWHCDSIWRTWTKDGDIGDVWERVYHGDWSDSSSDHLLLRLPCDELDDCCTVYMGIQDTEDLYYTRDCGQCWNKAVNQKLTIQDFAVESENIVYVLDDDGYVSTSTQYGRRPSDGVDTEVGSGSSITSCCVNGIVAVGGQGDEPVAWSDDGGETWELTDDLPNGDSNADVTVACYDCDGTTTIFAAVSDNSTGGIYRTTTDSGAWDDLNANAYDYDGIAIGRSDGTLYAVSDSITVDPDEDCLCDRFVDYHWNGNSGDHYSGVARNLTPCETECCGEESWDYLIAGLSTGGGREDFDGNPSWLRICGCTSIDTNSVLWAIDWEEYNVVDASDGTLWSYEDCAAKKGIVLTSPADESIVACDACETCDGAPLTFKWERMCLACSYDIEIMDKDGNLIVATEELEITGSPPELYWDGLVTYDPEGCTTGDQKPLKCGSTYTWHVREANTETDECVHSPWSETWSFTIEASSANAVQLIAPEVGAMGVPQSGAGFSWTSVPEATSYSFVLSANADLSGAMATSDQSGTAYAYSGTLDYEVAYYWQVTAWKDGIMLSQSDIGTFSTAPEEIIVEPPAPTPAPVINIPATQQIVPMWIYAMIGIGAALIVVVIVLIVRSRGSKS